jgi:hypothetical protein
MIADWIPLDRQVLVVAIVDNLPGLYLGKEGEWAAYIGAVKGENHEIELDEVARRGTKIPLWIAEKLFPLTARSYKWRP